MSNKISLLSEYLFTGNLKTPCDENLAKANGIVDISNYEVVTPFSVDQLKSALEIGPVGIAVEATSTEFQHFSSGIMTSSNCGQNVDHAVVAVGYGIQNGVEYVTVRNSWGLFFGDQGYIHIALNQSNICGILTQPYYPVV